MPKVSKNVNKNLDILQSDAKPKCLENMKGAMSMLAVTKTLMKRFDSGMHLFYTTKEEQTVRRIYTRYTKEEKEAPGVQGTMLKIIGAALGQNIDELKRNLETFAGYGNTSLKELRELFDKIVEKVSCHLDSSEIGVTRGNMELIKEEVEDMSISQAQKNLVIGLVTMKGLELILGNLTQSIGQQTIFQVINKSKKLANLAISSGLIKALCETSKFAKQVMNGEKVKKFTAAEMMFFNGLGEPQTAFGKRCASGEEYSFLSMLENANLVPILRNLIPADKWKQICDVLIGKNSNVNMLDMDLLSSFNDRLQRGSWDKETVKVITSGLRDTNDQVRAFAASLTPEVAAKKVKELVRGIEMRGDRHVPMPSK